MEQFFRDLGFDIADDLPLAIAIGGLCALAGVLVAVRAWADKEDLGDYRFFAVVVGLGIAATIAVAMPLLHRMAESACDRWERSGTPADRLEAAQHRCTDLF